MHGTVEGQLHVNIQGGIARSPIRAPFGSVQFSSTLKPKVLFDFLKFVCESLAEKKVTQLFLTNPPDFYSPPASSLLNTFLFNLGFSVERAEVGTVLEMKNDFDSNISKWELRKLRQAEEEGLRFKQLDIDALESVYAFILACRKEREYQLSITWETLYATVNTFKDRFPLFAVTHQDDLVAASISIDVGNGVMYNFHSAHPRSYDHLSPVVMLLKGIHHYCIEQNFRLLDLGTSALEGLPNFGLLDFKLGLGAQPTTKLTFKKEL